MKTNQEIFDQVATHLLTQGRPARDPNDNMCLYRSSDGLKCAIGCLIPDEVYDPAMEGLRVHALTSDTLAGLDPENPLLAELQRLHDDCTTTLDGEYQTEHLKHRLAGVAQRYNLTIEVLQ